MQVVDRIGKYRIVARLGEGAFGEVYRAEDPVMDRQVAIKIINAEGDSRVVDSFRREAATTARLRHKNIVTVYDYGDHEGNPFLAMELLEGETFASIIARAADLTTLERLEMLTQVGEGLHYAHAQRVVHCDIKPANLMRLTDGSVKILDFGVSRVIEDLSARRTRRRESAGTVLYMAPEQFEGMEADVLTDVFSYGVVCYELLAGTHPFAAAENSNAMYRIASQRPVPLRERWPSCPEQLEAIVERALHRNRRMRYPGAGDICVDLQDLSQGLRVEESQRLFALAAKQAESGDLPAALTSSRRALEYDPGNPEIRKFRDSVRRSIESGARAAQTASVLVEADRMLERRLYNEAIDMLERALREDEANPVLSAKLQEARGRQRARREAGLLIASAREHLTAGELDKAADLIAEASALDEENAAIAPLRSELHTAVEARARQARIDAALTEADRLRAAEEFAAALSAIDDVEAREGACPQLAPLRERIWTEEQAWRARKAEQAYRERVRNAARTLETPTLATEELARLCDDLLAGVAAYPKDQEGRMVLAQAQRQLRERQRQEVIARALNAAQACRAEDPERALAILADATRMAGRNQAVLELQAVIADELEQRRRRERLRALVAAAGVLTGREAWAEALAVLEQARSEFAAEPEFVEALAAARAGEAIGEADRLTREFRWLDALERIDRCLVEVPDSAGLQAARERVRAGFADEELRAGEFATEVDRCVQARDFAGAVCAARSARASLPHRIDALELELKAWTALRKAELRRAVDEITGYLRSGDIRLAERYLTMAEAAFRGEKTLQILRSDLEHRRNSASDAALKAGGGSQKGTGRR